MKISNRPIAGAASAFLLLCSFAATTANAFAADGGQQVHADDHGGTAAAEIGPPGGGPNPGGRPHCHNNNVPSGNKYAFSLFAEGAQIYRWDGANWTVVSSKAL